MYAPYRARGRRRHDQARVRRPCARADRTRHGRRANQADAMSPTNDRVEVDGWRLTLALPDPVQELRERLIEFVVAVADGRLVEPMRRSRHARTFQTQFVAAAGTPISLFVKVIEQPRRMKRLKRIFRGSPARHVVRVTAELGAAGLRAPPVWIFGNEIATRRELLVTPRAEGNGPLHTLAGRAGAVATKRAILRALGAEIARLHRGGFVHGDLTPFNIFIVCGEPPRFVLLDHERTRRSFFLGRTRRQLRNLVQLGRFNLPGLSRTDRLRTLAAYAATINPRAPRALARRVNAMLERRIRHDGGLQEVIPPAMIHSNASV